MKSFVDARKGLSMTNNERLEILRNSNIESDTELTRGVFNLKRLFQELPIGFLLFRNTECDRLVLEYANREAKALLGIEHEDKKGLRFDDLLYGSQQRRLTRNLLKILKTGRRFESDEVFYKDDPAERFVYRLVAYSLSKKDLVITLRDVTEQKQLEAELIERKTRLKTLTESAFDGIVVHNEGSILYGNPAFSVMFGYKDSQIVGTRLSDCIAPKDYGWMSVAIRNGSDFWYKTEGKRKDGSIFPIEIVGKYCRYEGHVARIAIIRTIETREKVKALEVKNRELSALSIKDGLTDLVNYRYFQECLKREVERSSRTGLPLSLIMIDIDHFKHVNDQYGHQTGDDVLARMSKILGEKRRINDIVARYGGEEFAIILPDTPCLAAAKVAERLRIRVASQTFVCREHRLSNEVTLSLGVASAPLNATDPERLVSAADIALYNAKRLGRNRVELASNSENLCVGAIVTMNPETIAIRQ